MTHEKLKTSSNFSSGYVSKRIYRTEKLQGDIIKKEDVCQDKRRCFSEVEDVSQKIF